MEFFGFSSSAPNLDASFSTFPEAILKNFNPDISQTPVLTSPMLDPETSMIQLPSLSQIFSTPDIKAWGAEVGLLVQSLLDELGRLSEKPLVRHVVVGIVTAAIVYGALKTRSSWSEDIHFDLHSPGRHGLFRPPGTTAPSKPPAQLRKKKSSHCLQVACRKTPVREKTGAVGDLKLPDYLHAETGTKARAVVTSVAWTNTESESVPSVNIETIISSTEQFQRQLTEALGKLDEVRLKLVELENDKNLLTAEIELRKKIINRLQSENTFERDKRQQAELKMEMMEIENNQLRQVRKELLMKAGQVERLEKFLREKEEQQERLFDENVVLPRSVAHVRAKEFGELQNRIQKLESELSLSAINVNSRSQIPPNEGPALQGRREKNFCSHANTVEGRNRKVTAENGPQSGDTPRGSASISSPQNAPSFKTSLQKTNSSEISLAAAANEPAMSETGRSSRSRGKGVIAQLRAFITGNDDSGSEYDEEMPADEDNYQPSDGQSSVFMSASCGSESSGNEVTVISNKAYLKKARADASRRVVRCKRKKQSQCEGDVNVSKCLQESQEEPLDDPGTAASTEDTNCGSPTNARLTPCSRTSSLHSTDSAKKESNSSHDHANAGSSEERGTESEESWTVILPTLD